jgi:methionine synthase II (cobalamin-independent)
MESVRLLRADQIGSLLRPQALLDARAACQAGRLSEAELSHLEDEAILAVLRAQAAAHQQIFVDGEFRRTGFMTAFLTPSKASCRTPTCRSPGRAERGPKAHRRTLSW